MSSLSKSLYQLSVLCIFLVDLGKLVCWSQEECTSHIQFISINAVVCQYQWDCTAPGQNGQRYIPSERNRDALNAMTDGGSLHIYRVPTLDDSCYGPVTAIEYCYRYRTTAGSGQPTFNWTVLILEETPGNDFVTNRILSIASRLPVNSANCTNTCCDRTNIEEFDLPTSNFAFGVTESAQGNTHGATLLGFSDTLSQYWVDTIQFNKNEETISIGSTIYLRNRPAAERSIRMLWFIIGKLVENLITILIVCLPCNNKSLLCLLFRYFTN